MPKRIKKSIPHEVYEQWINNLNQMTTACIENIESKFNNPILDIFDGETEFLYHSYLEMAPETIQIFHLMNTKYTWLLRHSINVAALSLIISILMGYSEEDKRKIITGALFHDVGKMVISGDILQKPAALTDDEMAVIYRHPLSGYRMIADSNLDTESKLIVLQHHERLDGSGYPDKLKEDAIFQGAKIVMIADSLDAMTSFRPYKSAQSMPNALNSIRKDGNKYDQSIISSLRQLLPQSFSSVSAPLTTKADYRK